MADLTPLVVKKLLFLNAWSVTSGIFNQGKTTAMKMIDNKNSKALKVYEIFNSMEGTPEAVTEAGLKMFTLSYGEYFHLN